MHKRKVRLYTKLFPWRILVWKKVFNSAMTKQILSINSKPISPFITGLITSVIRQKDESQNGCFKKTKHVKFSEKRTFLTPWYTLVRAYLGVRNTRFSENLTCFIFLKHPFWDSPFCFITDDNALMKLG